MFGHIYTYKRSKNSLARFNAMHKTYLELLSYIITIHIYCKKEEIEMFQLLLFLILLLCNTSNVISFQLKMLFKSSSPSKSISKSASITIPSTDKTLKFPLGKIAFSLIPLTPESVGRRKTILTEVVKDKIFTLDQMQGIINVNVPVRSTIIKLKNNGGLFINNPVAPTIECINIMKSMEEKHGRVKHIALSSLAVEHKGTIGAFSRYFPDAVIYIQQDQFSFPVNLPSNLYFPIGTKIIELANDKVYPWSSEILHDVLTVRPSAIGGYGETAFFHKDTNTLLVTDIIVKVDDEAPTIIQDDPRSLLYHARDNMLQEITDTKENRKKGWRRMTIFALTFNPSGIKVNNFINTFKMLKEVSPQMKLLGENAVPIDGGFYPWEWVDDEIPSFKSLQGGLLVAPILQKLLLNRDPLNVLAWVDRVSKWNFKRIIPCHFANDIKTNSKDFYNSFDFLRLNVKSKRIQPNSKDCQLLTDASIILEKLGILYKDKMKT